MARYRLLFSTAALALSALALGASPYVGEQSRAIKSLSDHEVADYLAGKGIGFAKAAELNGYPGPAHVLELADKLALTPAQKQNTAQLFGRMQSRAGALGARLVDEERALDASFASKSISRDELARALRSIAALQGQIRETHLQAHLDQAEILSENQKAEYWRLRGYATDASSHHRH